MGFFIDLFSGKSGWTVSDNMGMNEDGDLLMRTSDNTAINMDTGEMSFLTGNPFSDDDDNDNW